MYLLTLTLQPSPTQAILRLLQFFRAAEPITASVPGRAISLIPLYKKHSFPMYSTPSGISICFRFSHFQNVLVSSFFMVEGNYTSSTALSAKTHPSYSLLELTTPSFSRPSFSHTLFSFLHFANAFAPTSFTVVGRITLSRPLPAKLFSPIVSSPSRNWTFPRLSQSQNAPYSMFYSPHGKLIFVRLLQLQNAHLPIFFRQLPSSNTISFMLLQLKNASFWISVTLFGTIILYVSKVMNWLRVIFSVPCGTIYVV